MLTSSPRDTRWFAVEAITLLAILGLNIAGVKPFATGTLLFVLPLGVISMRQRGITWKQVGLSLPTDWKRDLLIGVAGGVAVQGVISLIIDPLMTRLGLAAPHVEGLAKIASGGVAGFLVTLVLVWIVGGLLEEACFRGYLLRRVRTIVGEHGGSATGIVVSTLYFGLSHWYQGPRGTIEAGVAGLCFGVAYVRRGNLLLPIVLHGALDTVGIILLAMGFTGW